MTKGTHGDITKTIKSYGSGLRDFIRRRVRNEADAEDILQDVWYQFSAIINSRPVEQVGAWLYRVARNRIIDRQRKRVELPWQESAQAADTDPETLYRDRTIRDQLFRALEELPMAQREVFVMHELEGMSFAAIAAATGEPESRLVLRKYYAVRHLRKRLRIFYDDLVDQ